MTNSRFPIELLGEVATRSSVATTISLFNTCKQPLDTVAIIKLLQRDFGIQPGLLDRYLTTNDHEQNRDILRKFYLRLHQLEAILYRHKDHDLLNILYETDTHHHLLNCLCGKTLNANFKHNDKVNWIRLTIYAKSTVFVMQKDVRNPVSINTAHFIALKSKNNALAQELSLYYGPLSPKRQIEDAFDSDNLLKIQELLEAHPEAVNPIQILCKAQSVEAVALLEKYYGISSKLRHIPAAYHLSLLIEYMHVSQQKDIGTLIKETTFHPFYLFEQAIELSATHVVAYFIKNISQFTFEDMPLAILIHAAIRVGNEALFFELIKIFPNNIDNHSFILALESNNAVFIEAHKTKEGLISNAGMLGVMSISDVVSLFPKLFTLYMTKEYLFAYLEKFNDASIFFSDPEIKNAPTRNLLSIIASLFSVCVVNRNKMDDGVLTQVGHVQHLLRKPRLKNKVFEFLAVNMQPAMINNNEFLQSIKEHILPQIDYFCSIDSAWLMAFQQSVANAEICNPDLLPLLNKLEDLMPTIKTYRMRQERKASHVLPSDDTQEPQMKKPKT